MSKAIKKENEAIVSSEIDDGLARKVRSMFTYFTPTKMELHHAMGGGGQVMWWHAEALKQLVGSEGGPDAVARAVQQNARDDAATYTGSQRYVLLTWVDGTKAPMRYGFTVQGGAWAGVEDDEGALFDGGESPNAKGLLAMAMRQANESHKLSVHGAAKMLEVQQRTLDRYAAQQDELFKGLLKVTDLVRELSDQQFERDMKREDKLMVRDVVKTVGKGVSDALPGLMLRFSPSGSSAVEQLVMQFVGRVGEKRLTEFVMTLAPEEQEAFMALYNALIARQNTPGGGTPPSNAPPGA
jgi:hypothetical protein